MRLNLSPILERRGVNQSQLAEGIGTSRQAVNNWIHGRAFPDADLLEQICAVARDGQREDLAGSPVGSSRSTAKAHARRAERPTQ